MNGWNVYDLEQPFSFRVIAYVETKARKIQNILKQM